jgi:hypothetical protein
MRTECIAFSTDLDCQAHAFLGAARKTAAVTRVRYLERQAFDGSSRRHRSIAESEVADLVTQINQLRGVLGWLQIDLHGQWRWPN